MMKATDTHELAEASVMRVAQETRQRRELLELLERRLERWAHWRRVGSNAGWASMVAWLRLSGASNRGNSVPLPPNIDEEASNTDAAVCRLPGIYREVVMAEYCIGGTQVMKARRIGINERTYRYRLAVAHGQLVAALYHSGRQAC